MNFKYTLVAFFILLASIGNIAAQSKIMYIHTKDGNVVQFNVSEVDSITFKQNSSVYTPSFKQTNLKEGCWDGFAAYGDRLFASNTLWGIAEYINGEWVGASGILEGSFDFPVIKASGDKFFIATPRGITCQSGDDSYYWTLQYTTADYSGALGGSLSNFFVGAGTNGNGIYKWNGIYFVNTNQTMGCWYSIEALDENTVFFGAGASHVSGNYGIMRWDDSQQKIVETNLNAGVYNLTLHNNKMYAEGQGAAYVWNGSTFDKIFDGGVGKLKSTGGNLYCFYSDGVGKFNAATNSFDPFLSNSYGYFEEIEEYQGFIYLFGAKIMACDKSTGNWMDVSADSGYMNRVIATKQGLFISGSNTNSGIQIMTPIY